jgi:hypothetical protein
MSKANLPQNQETPFASMRQEPWPEALEHPKPSAFPQARRYALQRFPEYSSCPADNAIPHLS